MIIQCWLNRLKSKLQSPIKPYLAPLGLFVFTLGTALLLLNSNSLARLELAWLDRQFQLVRYFKTQPLNPDVVVVGIDDQALEQFAEQPIALWHPHLGKFFQALALATPLVVGLDITLPTHSYDSFLKQDYDKPLLLGIRALRQQTPLILGRTVNSASKVQPIERRILLMAGGDARTGYVLYQQDLDHGVRRFADKLQKDGQLLPTLVGRMAEALNLKPQTGLINYTVGLPFSYIPFHQVLAWYDQGNIEQIKRIFSGQAVLLGSVLLFEDRHPFPVKLAAWEAHNQYLPGVLFHAQALRSLLTAGLIQPVPSFWLIGLALTLISFWWLGAKPKQAVLLFIAVSGSLLLGSVLLLQQGWWLQTLSVLAVGLLVLIARLGRDIVLKMRERHRLRNLFGHYVSPPILNEILAGHLDAGLGGQRQRICVLFSDIRNFTTRSENMPPEEVIALLNRFFETMTQAIHAQEGTIDKFMGDGIMAFFGAPKPLEHLCRHAFTAATAMLQGLQELNQTLQREGIEPIQIGIALHVGEAVVGHVGAVCRHEYTAIGDMVNVASRLEGLTKTVGYSLVCSQPVVQDLPDIAFIALGKQAIKGHAPVPVWSWEPSKITDSGVASC